MIKKVIVNSILTLQIINFWADMDLSAIRLLLIFMHCYLICFKISFPWYLRVYVCLLVLFIISSDKTTHVLWESSNRRSICKSCSPYLVSMRVLKAISHGNTLLVSNDLIPPLLHTLRNVFTKNYVHHICIVYLSLHLQGIL